MAKVRRQKEALTGAVWFYDLEAENWDQVVYAHAISLSGEEHSFSGPSALRQMAELQQERRGTWWAHGGGIYDHLLSWRASEWPDELVLTGSSVLNAKFKANKRARVAPLVFRDTVPAWLCALKKAGEKLCPLPAGHKFTHPQCLHKLDVDRTKIGQLTPEETAAYCRRDVQILREGYIQWREFLDGHGVQGGSTSGGIAVKLLEQLDPDTWESLCNPRNLCDLEMMVGKIEEEGADHRLGPEIVEGSCGALDAVRGGRAETRRIGRVEGPVYCYDVHSSYPSQYYHPAGIPIGLERDESKSLDGFWLDLVTWQQDLPLYGPKGGKVRSHWEAQRQGTPLEQGQYGEGTGRLTAWLISETARELAKQGCRPVRHGLGWKPTEVVPNFAHEFARVMYAEKESGNRNSWFAKVAYNSLHGKFCENPIKFKYLRKDCPSVDLGERVTWRDFYEKAFSPMKWAGHGTGVSPHMQPLAGAFILGRARLKLSLGIQAVERAGFEAYYWDTDSIHTNCPPEVFGRIQELGPELGKWGLEMTAERAYYLAPKSYLLVDGKKEKSAAKGMDKQKVNEALFQQALMQEGVEVARSGLSRFLQGPGKAGAGTRSELIRTLRPVVGNGRELKEGRLWYV